MKKEELSKTAKEVIDIISKSTEIDKKDINYNTNISADLDIESLELVDLVVTIEEKYGVDIPDKEIKKIQTVGDLIAYIDSHKEA